MITLNNLGAVILLFLLQLDLLFALFLTTLVTIKEKMN